MGVPKPAPEGMQGALQGLAGRLTVEIAIETPKRGTGWRWSIPPPSHRLAATQHPASAMPTGDRCEEEDLRAQKTVAPTCQMRARGRP